MDPPTLNAMDASAAAASDSSCCDHRLLEASSKGQTDAVLQLLEENGQHLHTFKDKVRFCAMVIICYCTHNGRKIVRFREEKEQPFCQPLC